MATLTQARERLQIISGRYDLSIADLTYYLNRAQNFLDERTDFQKAPHRYQITLSAGDFVGLIASAARAIQGVWAFYDGERHELSPATPEYVRQEYGDALAQIDRGKPLYYVIDPLTYLNASGEFAYYTGAYADSFSQSGVLVMPPPDVETVIEVNGRFYSPTLSATQSSWWLTSHSELLVRAALRELEIDYRNTEGRKDWEAALQFGVDSLDKDLAEEDLAGVVRMEG